MRNAGHVLREAARFWEPRRLPYNAILTGVVVALATANWSAFGSARPLALLAALLLLGVLANLCYCTAYLLDCTLQATNRPLHRLRWALWGAGTALSVLLAAYWLLDEILPTQ